MLKQLTKNETCPWTMDGGLEKDVILCSRVRLARNFADYPFPLKQTEKTGEQVLANMAEFCQENEELKFYDLQQVEVLDKQILVEKHLISPEHSKDDQHYRGLVLNPEGSVSIMVNEEDHLRIQCFAPGMNLQELWLKADELDNAIESRYRYAFHERLGYLTCCPSNLGNGMRASVMMHLPGLAMTKRLPLLDQLNNFGMTVRGLFGEGSKSLGDLYQISNKVTIGQTETDILTNLHSVAQQIIKEEKNARNYLWEYNRVPLEDKIWRSWGILSNARYLSAEEGLELTSTVRLGCTLGILPQVDLATLDKIYLIMQPAYLQGQKATLTNEQERSEYRAQCIRELLK